VHKYHPSIFQNRNFIPGAFRIDSVLPNTDPRQRVKNRSLVLSPLKTYNLRRQNSKLDFSYNYFVAVKDNSLTSQTLLTSRQKKVDSSLDKPFFIFSVQEFVVPVFVHHHSIFEATRH
jgi:hypothetical protein